MVREKMNRLITATANKGLREADVQSGDTQGLSNAEQANSESVEELAADGQSFEAAAVSGVEDADDPDVRDRRQPTSSRVHTRRDAALRAVAG